MLFSSSCRSIAPGVSDVEGNPKLRGGKGQMLWRFLSWHAQPLLSPLQGRPAQTHGGSARRHLFP